jgi:hypothetical protein
VDTFETALLGYWKLAGDARDHSGKGRHGRPHGVDFSAAGPAGAPGTAACFDGVADCIEVADHPELALGKGPFSLAAWVRVEEEHADVVGDIAAKYDPASRRGFNLYINASSAGYNSHGDSRHLHFGIDNAVDAAWEDCGILHPENTYVSSLTVHEGQLYAAQADALGLGSRSCHVWRYAGGQGWEDCGRVSPDLGQRSAYALLVHRGSLYCGTGRQDWMASGPDHGSFVHVYRYLGGTEWEDLGQVGRNYRILSLASFRGELYCGTDVCHPLIHADSCRVFRHRGGKEWEDCGRPGEQRHVFSLMVHDGQLYAGGDGQIHRYLGGTEWEYLGQPFGNTQVHCLQVYRGDLWAGTWPQGHIARYAHGQSWEDMGLVGDTRPFLRERINEINDLTVHNGSFFAGVIPKGEVYRYQGGGRWEMMRRLLPNPGYDPGQVDSWARVPCLTAHGGMLYAGTGTCRGYAEEKPLPEAGRVYRTGIGQAQAHEHDLGNGWRHVTAVREADRLRLYLDGRQVAGSQTFAGSSYDLQTHVPLHLGFGSVDYFSGALAEVRLYGRALNPEEVAALARRP